MPTRIFLATLVSLLCACSTIAEIAYDNKLDRDRSACNQALDNNAYRQCMDRIRAVEKEADKARKGS